MDFQLTSFSLFREAGLWDGVQGATLLSGPPWEESATLSAHFVIWDWLGWWGGILIPSGNSWPYDAIWLLVYWFIQGGLLREGTCIVISGPKGRSMFISSAQAGRPVSAEIHLSLPPPVLGLHVCYYA